MCTVYLISSGGSSQESSRAVESLVDLLLPEAVFLGQSSLGRLTVLSAQAFRVPTYGQIFSSLQRNHSPYPVLSQLFLATVACYFEKLPGAAFRAAVEVADKHGCDLVLGDRPLLITVKRAWGSMSVWEKVKLPHTILYWSTELLCSLANEADNLLIQKEPERQLQIQAANNVDLLTLATRKICQHFPSVRVTIEDETDMYMTAMLRGAAMNRRSVVAVVGRGHLPGIRNKWMDQISIDKLLEVPQENSVEFSAFTFVLASMVVAAAGSCFFFLRRS